MMTTVWLVNQPFFYKKMFSMVSNLSSWDVKVKKFEWLPLRAEVKMFGLMLNNEKKETSANVSDLSVRLRPLYLLRGRLNLKIKMGALTLKIAKQAKKARKKINLTRLLLFKRLNIDKLVIDSVKVKFADLNWSANNFEIGLAPKSFTETAFTLRSENISIVGQDKNLLKSDTLTIISSTKLKKWRQNFPYVNALNGRVNLENAVIETFKIPVIQAGLKYVDSSFDLDPLRFRFGSADMEGNVSVDIQKETFSGLFDIPTAVELPYLIKRSGTFDTKGSIVGRIKFAGKGIKPLTSKGKAQIDVTYKFSVDPEYPVNVKANAVWSSKKIVISDGVAKANSNEILIAGNLDALNKTMAFAFAGKQFPVEAFFRKMTNPSLKRIFGKTDLEGKIGGWGKKFKLSLSAVTFDGGWQPLSAKKVVSEFNATYNNLNFDWIIKDGERNSGHAKLNIDMGKRLPDGKRAKYFLLDANLEEYPIGDTFGIYKFNGSINASTKLKGRIGKLEGAILFDFDDGSWWNLPISQAAGEVDLSWKKMVLSKLILTLPIGKENIQLVSPLTIDFKKGKTTLVGKPFNGLNIDAQYKYSNREWHFKKMSYQDEGNDIHLTGDFGESNIDLKLAGSFPAEWVSILGQPFGFTSGRFNADMQLKGDAKSPLAYGSLNLQGVQWYARKYGVAIENTNSTLKFAGPKVIVQSMEGSWGDGTFTLAGDLRLENLIPTNFDLLLKGKSIPWRLAEGNLRLEVDCDVAINGRAQSPLIKGDVTILDGRYTKDFNILDVVTPKAAPVVTMKKSNAPRLDLRVRNTGDLLIRNNVGDIWLNADMVLKGTSSRPSAEGSITVTEGKVKYLGLNFEITRGFMELRAQYDVPYIEVTAEREIDIYTINLTLFGNIDNLLLDLNTTSPSGTYGKRDSLVLLLTGQPPTVTAGGSFGSEFSGAVVGGGVTQVLSGPVTAFTGLDTFRLETVAGDETDDDGRKSDGIALKRVTVGKRISDRLEMSLSADIGSGEAVPLVAAEYSLIDNFLVKGSRGSVESYYLQGILRFRLR